MSKHDYQVTRRSLAKGVAVGFATGAIAPSLALADETTQTSNEPASWRDAPEPIDDSQISETVETDVLVVGLGNSGIVAACSAAESGARVTVIEKTSMPGMARGFLGMVGTSISEDLGIEVNKFEAAELLARYASHDCDMDLLLAWAENSGETFDWMSEKLGATCGYEAGLMHDIGEYVSGGADDLYRTVPIHHYFSNGTEYVRTWVADWAEHIADEGVDVRYETTMKQLIKDGDRVSGAIALTADDTYIKFVATKGVILCTGGYSQNDEMMLDRQPEVVALCGNNQSGNTDGSGIRAALWVGADMDVNPTSMYFDRAGMVPSTNYTNYMLTPVEGNAYLLMGSQPFLHVNLDGERFSNEALPYDFKANAARRQPNQCWITVWDANWKQDVERFHTIGCSRIAQPEDGLAYTSFEQVESTHEQLLESGRLQTADTLEELAEKLCIRNVDAFMDTVERYNELTDLDVDEDYGKPSYRLSHIAEPPFYGAMVKANLLCTLDGLRINTDMQVLDTDANPIPGLYAAGNDSGGFFSGNYPELLVGVAVGRSVTFGRIAGKKAAEGA